MRTNLILRILVHLVHECLCIESLVGGTELLLLLHEVMLVV
jgi:hypothetical protein